MGLSAQIGVTGFGAFDVAHPAFHTNRVSVFDVDHPDVALPVLYIKHKMFTDVNPLICRLSSIYILLKSS